MDGFRVFAWNVFWVKTLFVTLFCFCVAFLRRHRGRGVARSIGRWCRGASRACGLLGRPVGGACRR
nr:MAG TPA: hypothetical protein [Caudoviricetes sp.]